MSEFPHDLIALVAGGLAVAIFAYVGINLFRKGWSSYEDRYVEGAGRTLDSMYLTIPSQHLMYLAFLTAAVLTGVLLVLTGQLLLAVPLGLSGLFLPLLVLRWLKKKRDEKFNLQLVDSLMNVSNSLKAGMTLPQAFEVLAREMANPMCQEMRLLCSELRLGRSMEEALNHLYKRMPSADLDLVVTSIIIVQDVGGNLTEIFDNIAHTIRERLRIEGKIRALTSQGKAQAGLMCLLPFIVGLGMHLATPGMLDPLFTTLPGGTVLLLALIIEAVGIFLILKIIKIDI